MVAQSKNMAAEIQDLSENMSKDYGLAGKEWMAENERE